MTLPAGASGVSTHAPEHVTRQRSQKLRRDLNIESFLAHRTHSACGFVGECEVMQDANRHDFLCGACGVLVVEWDVMDAYRDGADLPEPLAEDSGLWPPQTLEERE